MIAADVPLLQSIIEQQQKPLAQICAERFGRFVRTQFDPDSQESWNVVDKLWRAAIMSRDAEHAIQLVAARPIERPRYHSTPLSLASFSVWFRANQPRVWNYWCALDRAADADPERTGAMDEFWDFARCQYDIEVVCRDGVPL